MNGEDKRREKVNVLAMEGDDIVVVHRKENANSFETGKPGNRFKIFYADAEDLKKQIKELQDAGFIVE